MQALVIEHLTKIYRNGVMALQDISLEVKQGDFFALLGPNGAGKSTTIGIITSLVNKTHGNISIFGHNLETSPAQAKMCIGLVPQEFNLNIFAKVIDILTTQAGYYGVKKSVAQERAEYYLKKLSLWHKRDHTSQSLSGGQKRRLMIARALIHQPPLLILDEPSAGVDIEIRRSMWTFMKELNQQGTTIVLTTHYLEEAESLCKNIAIINHGKIIENTSMKTLLNKLQVETLVLYLKKPLTVKPNLQEFDSHLLDETTLEVPIYQHQSLNHLFDELSKQAIEIVSMRNKTNRLEELFIKLIDEKKHAH